MWGVGFSVAYIELDFSLQLFMSCHLSLGFLKNTTNAAFKTGFRAAPDKPDKAASGQKTHLQSGVGFMWLPRESFK